MKTMTLKRIHFYLLAALLFVIPFNGQAQTKLKSLTKVQSADERVLIGYGLITGLDRTGDRTIRRSGAAFTVQSIANMLQNFGITVDPDMLRTRNVAAVMVTATLGPYNATGSYVDVTVSSLGDATSLMGGVLLQTPLTDPQDEDFFVKAQGPLIVGGISAETAGARVRQNQTLTGTVPGGGIVISNTTFRPNKSRPLGLVLKQPNYTNAERISETINQRFGNPLAEVINAGLIEVQWPQQLQRIGELNLFVSEVMELEITTDIIPRIVINERTGTVVAGGGVRIGEVLVSHGNIQIQTQQSPFVSQPAPLSLQGETVIGSSGSASITEGPSKTFVLEGDISVTELAASLNRLGLTPRDIIAIFQAINRAGALKGELVVM